MANEDTIEWSPNYTLKLTDFKSKSNISSRTSFAASYFFPFLLYFKKYSR